MTNHTITPQKSSKTLIAAVFTISFIFLALCGGSVYWLVQDQHYPAAEQLSGVGKCGTAESYYYGKSLRVSTQRCLITSDSQGEIAVWYQSQGYRWQNDGQVQLDHYEAVIDLFRTERVYILQLEDGRRDIRIYTDYTVRFP